MDSWIGEVVGAMRLNHISNIDLANKLGVTPVYISMILNGRKTPKEAEAKIKTAIAKIIFEKEGEGKEKKEKIKDLLTERVEELCKEAKNSSPKEQALYSFAILRTIESLNIFVNSL